MRFFTSFYVIVTAKLVFSSECHGGYFSEEHNTCIDCPEHCQHCESSKMCLSCEDGYWGSICELPCSRCQPKTSCEKTNGFCLVKCKDGYTGILCDAFCNDKCLNCDRMDAGQCELCALGRYGESCDKRCPEFCYNNTCNDTGYCTYGCDSGYWGPKCGNKDEENDEKAANVEEEGQTANDDKENEASHQGGEIWPVILIVVAVLIIVSVLACVVFRKKLINLKRSRLTRQDKPDIPAERPFLETTETKTSKDSGVCIQENPHASLTQNTVEPEAPADSPLIQTRELTASEDSGVFSQDSPPTSLTQDTVKLLQPDTAINTNNKPRNDQLEKIIIIPEFTTDQQEAGVSLGPGFLQQDKTATTKALSIAGEKAPSPSVKNSTESAKSSDRENATGLDNDSRAEAPLESLKVRHVSDLSGTKAYIICKDPTNKSMTDSVFWKLVWQEGCSVIVKLSGAIEDTRERRYWPEKNKEGIYGDFIVFNEGEVLFDDYRRRTFTIKKDQNTGPRKVEQIQFIKWPIFKLPEDNSLITFRQEVNKDRKTGHGPLLVHCRDGFSRSFVFVAMDILLGVLEKKDHHGDIGNILTELEEKGLITNPENGPFLRKHWEIFSTQMNTNEGLSAPANRTSPSLLITT